MLNKYFIVIGGGYHQLPLIREIKKMAYGVIVVDINSDALGFNFADVRLVHDSYDFKGLYLKLKRITKNREIVGVITQAARNSIFTTAYLSEKFATKWLNAKTAALTINKKEISKIFNQDIYISSIKTINFYPVVIRNQKLSGSTGVYKIKSRDELEKFRNNLSKKDESDLVVEKFVRGRHFMVFGLKGKDFLKIYGMAEKYLNNKMKTKLVIFPAEIKKEIEKKINKFVKKALEKIEFDFGPFMFELIYGEGGGIYLAEIEASLQGSHFVDFMIPSVSDAYPIIDTINLILNKKIKKRVKKTSLFYAQNYFYATKYGKVDYLELKMCDKEIIIFPHIDTANASVEPSLYIYNTAIVGNTKKREDFLEKLNKCKIKVRYK